MIHVGPDRAVTTIAEAAKIAQDGDVVLIDAGEFPGGVASWPQDDLTIRGVGGRARIVAAGSDAEGKAMWVIKGDRVVIENIEFPERRCRIATARAYATRAASLTVRNCLFERNEMGLLDVEQPALRNWSSRRPSFVTMRSARNIIAATRSVTRSTSGRSPGSRCAKAMCTEARSGISSSPGPAKTTFFTTGSRMRWRAGRAMNSSSPMAGSRT